MHYSEIMKKSPLKTPTVLHMTYETKVSAIEKRYGVDLNAFADKTLGVFLTDKGYPSLAKMLQQA